MIRALGMAVLIVAMAVGMARADDPYPTRSISMVVAFPPGGLADNTARPVATALERILKQPVAIINKAGAAGAVGHPTEGTRKPAASPPPIGPRPTSEDTAGANTCAPAAATTPGRSA